jgi:hypothetical protein
MICVTMPRPPSDTRANCKGDHAPTAGDVASIVARLPSAPRIVNDDAVSAKIGPSMVPPCTSTAVMPPRLKKPPAVTVLNIRLFCVRNASTASSRTPGFTVT